jgi:hypothetical protein
VAVPDAPPAPEVFAARSLVASGSQVVSERECPQCHAKVPIKLGDYGRSTYCPACGTEVPVGEDLALEPASLPAISAPASPLPRAPAPAPAPPRRSWAAVAAAACLVLAGMLWLVLQPGRSPQPDSAPPKAAALAPPSGPRPDASITLKAIEELAAMESPAEALAKAEDWKQILTDLEVPSSDPRQAKLDAAIAALRIKLVPAAQPTPPEVTEFLDQVKALTAALQGLMTAKQPDAPELVAGRAAMARADELLANHAEVLEPIAATYRQMRDSFREFASRLEGTKPIEALLKTAREQVDIDHPVEALETLAQARLVTLGTILNDSQRSGLEKLHKEIIDGPLQRSLCRRSLALAEQAGHTGDLHSRDWLAREAQAYLNLAIYHDPEADCTPLFGRLKALRDAPAAGPGQSTRIPVFQVRRRYEDALESFATWPLEESGRWVECTRDFDALARKLQDSQPAWAERVATLVLQGLRSRLDLLRAAGRDDLKVALALKGLYEAFAQVKVWQSRSEFRILRVDARSLAKELVGRLLGRAEQELAAASIDEALTTARLAEALASEPDVDRARKLVEQCQAAIALREDRHAQAEAWAKIEDLDKKHDAVAVWVALARFEKRFPGTDRTSPIAALRKAHEPEVRRRTPELLAQCDRCVREKRFGEYRGVVDRLGTFPLSPQDRAEVDNHRRRLAEIDREVEARMARVPGRMVTREDLIQVLDQLASVLALNPEHSGALARRTEAWNRARTFAADMLGTAELVARQPRLPDVQRDREIQRLGVVLKLMPPGPDRDRALALLQRLEKPAPARADAAAR